MDLRQLDYLVAIVDHGTFTAAARACHVAQPSLSQAIRALERELGVDLFHRVGRSAVLSSAGQAIVAHAREAQRAATAVRSAAAAANGLLTGRLQLVALPTLAVDPVTPLVGAYRRRYPGITVELVQPDDVASITERLRRGEAELALTELPVSGDDLRTRPLARQELVVVLPPTSAEPDRPEATAAPVTLVDLAALPLVTSPPGTSTRRLVDDALGAAGLAAAVAVETAQREAIVPLVLAGAGAAVLPGPLAAHAARLGAVLRPLDPPLRRSIGLVHRRGPLSPAAAAFVQLVPEGQEHPAPPEVEPICSAASRAHARR